MAKPSISVLAVAHPPWCDRPYIGPDDHDPHVSHRERVGDDSPGECAIEAYLLRPKLPVDPRRPSTPLAALEFSSPGAEPVAFVLTFAQLRRLDEALYRLVQQGESTPSA